MPGGKGEKLEDEVTVKQESVDAEDEKMEEDQPEEEGDAEEDDDEQINEDSGEEGSKRSLPDDEDEEKTTKRVTRSTPRKKQKINYADDEDDEDIDDPDDPDAESEDVEVSEAEEGEESGVNESEANGENAEDKSIIMVKAKCGNTWKIDLNADKPETFKTEKARIMWETATERNALRLKHQLETGEVTIAELEGRYEKTPQQIQREKRRALLRWLAIESRVITLDCNVRRSLQIDKKDHAACLKHLEDFTSLEIEPRMLLKNPSVVDTLFKVKSYTGDETIRQKAQSIFKRFTDMFEIPTDKDFTTVFKEEYHKFQDVVKDIPDNKVYLVTDSFMPGQDNNLGLNFDDDSDPPPKPRSFLIHGDGPVADIMADPDKVDIEENDPTFKEIKAEVKAEPLEVADE